MIRNELALADMETIERRLVKLKGGKAKAVKADEERAALQTILYGLE